MLRSALLTLACAASIAVVAPAHAATPFALSSPTLRPGAKLGPEQVLNGFGCQGGNVSPALRWQNPPAGTQSFAITVYDPDAPTGSGWWHWVVYNLPANTRALPAQAGDANGQLLPSGAVQGRTDFGAPGFGGACPPVGDKPHRYIFTVHALKVPQLDLPADASAALVGFMLHANRLGQASLTARYSR